MSSPELVYVSGRARPAGEINGKSGNLNNALNLIYPPGVPIPLDEAGLSKASPSPSHGSDLCSASV